MTADTDALTERIARALARRDGYDPDKHCDEWIMYGMRESAAAVLPIVEAEVRAAKAEALREAADAWHAEHEGTRPGPYGWMWDRATKYETGASDEHR